MHIDEKKWIDGIFAKGFTLPQMIEELKESDASEGKIKEFSEYYKGLEKKKMKAVSGLHHEEKKWVEEVVDKGFTKHEMTKKLEEHKVEEDKIKKFHDYHDSLSKEPKKEIKKPEYPMLPKQTLSKNDFLSPNQSTSPKGRIFVSIVLTAMIVWLVGFSFQFSSKCYDQACFDEKLKTCERSTFTGGNGEVVYKYSILGKSEDSCIVDVELLQGQLEEKESPFVEGKTMSCEIPFGSTIRPESEIQNCHGELREGLQEIVIQNLHSYVIKNLDKINEELESDDTSEDEISNETNSS